VSLKYLCLNYNDVTYRTKYSSTILIKKQSWCDHHLSLQNISQVFYTEYKWINNPIRHVLKSKKNTKWDTNKRVYYRFYVTDDEFSI